MERPAILCRVFGSADFIRVPKPAARITATRSISFPFGTDLLLAKEATPCQSLSLFWRSIRMSECNIVARTLLLDLDGTLVNSVPDLTAALDRLMVSRGLAPFTEAEVALMVGDGVAKLIERAFAARGRMPDDRAIADYSADYAQHA